MDSADNREAGAVAAPGRYGAIAVALHWLMAVLLIVLVGLGWWMTRLMANSATRAAAFPLYQLHKSLGFTTLGLALARIAWRIAHRAPTLPARMPRWERLAASATHAAFYLLLIAIPISGWMYISTKWAVTLDRPFEAGTQFFGLFDVPYLGPVSGLEAGLRRTFSFRFSAVHAWLAYALLALTALHVAASLKHHFLDRDSVLKHMLPIVRGGDRVETPDGARGTGLSSPAIWIAAFAALLLVAMAGWASRHPGLDSPDHHAAP